MPLNALAYLIGAGSMTLGVERAGVKVHGVFETSGYAKNAKSFRLNRPEMPFGVLELDFTSDHFAQYQGFDLIYGNPPCGGLSSMTCSRLSSPTNNCMRQWIRMVVKAKPRMILMENAYQLATTRVSPLLNDLTGVLDAAGYWWWTWMFYSFQVGTPQWRRRMFLCASLDRPRRMELLGLADLPSVANKGRDCCPCGPFLEDLTGVAPSLNPVYNTRGEMVLQHHYGEHRMAYFAHLGDLIRIHRERLKLPRCGDREYNKWKARAETGDAHAIQRMEGLEKEYWPGMPKEFDGMRMTRPGFIWFDRPAPAITGFFRFIHPIDDRVLTMREHARLMGYPDEWQFHAMKPSFVAQGVPANSTKWAVERMLRVIDHPEAN